MSSMSRRSVSCSSATACARTMTGRDRLACVRCSARLTTRSRRPPGLNRSRHSATCSSCCEEAPEPAVVLFLRARAARLSVAFGGCPVALVVFALLFAIPGGSDLSRALGGVVLGLLLLGAAAFVIVVAFFPRRRP